MAGPAAEQTEVLVSAERLRDFGAAVFRALGMSEEHAAMMGEQITWAHLHGHSWLGARKIIQYGTRVRSGVTAATGEPELLSDTPAFSLFDAHDTFSMIAGARVMAHTIAKARESGAAVSVVRNTTSAGALGYFVEMAADAGMVSIAINNGPPLMAPYGGTSKVIGNEAFAMGSPAGRHGQLNFDTALSAMTLVGFHGYEERGELLPEGVALDASGMPTVDPTEALKGMMVPMGGHRGYGLAVMWEILTGVLAGGDRFLTDVTMPDVFDRPQAVSMFFLVVDPALSMDSDDFLGRVDRLIDQMHASPPAPGVDRIFVPGERSAELAADRMREGIPIPQDMIDKLRDFGAEVGVAWG